MSTVADPLQWLQTSDLLLGFCLSEDLFMLESVRSGMPAHRLLFDGQLVYCTDAYVSVDLAIVPIAPHKALHVIASLLYGIVGSSLISSEENIYKYASNSCVLRGLRVRDCNGHLSYFSHFHVL